jgi:predicted nucleotidyltransferase
MQIDHGLSDKQLEIIKNVLVPFKDVIKSVGLFGSRATGKYRSNSDIDIVLYGALDEQTADRIFTLINDSNLPVKVDVQVYHLITYLPLKTHIDSIMQQLAIEL